MKKAISIVLALVLCMSLCACGGVSVHGSKFIGTYEHKGILTERYSGWGYNNLVNDISFKETLILEGGGVGTFKATATASGKYYQVGDVIKEGTVRWVVEGDYITITFSGTRYSKDYGNNSKEIVDYSTTYEKKAGTLHNASSGYSEYTKVG